jgi:hypothetical protein
VPVKASFAAGYWSVEMNANAADSSGATVTRQQQCHSLDSSFCMVTRAFGSFGSQNGQMR